MSGSWLLELRFPPLRLDMLPLGKAGDGFGGGTLLSSECVFCYSCLPMRKLSLSPPSWESPHLDRQKASAEADRVPEDMPKDNKDIALVSSISKNQVIGQTKVAINPSIPRKTYLQRLAIRTTSQGNWKDLIRHSYQPLIILFTIPTVFYMSLIYAVTSVWQTVMITVLSMAITMPPYNFSSSQIGMMSLPGFIGTSLGVLITGKLTDLSIIYVARRKKGIYEPEMRLYLMPFFIPFVPAGALMYGIGLEKGLAWPIVAVGFAMCNFGVAPICAMALTYITDLYTEVSTHVIPLEINWLICFQDCWRCLNRRHIYA